MKHKKSCTTNWQIELKIRCSVNVIKTGRKRRTDKLNYREASQLIIESILESYIFFSLFFHFFLSFLSVLFFLFFPSISQCNEHCLCKAYHLKKNVYFRVINMYGVSFVDDSHIEAFRWNLNFFFVNNIFSWKVWRLLFRIKVL